MLDWTGNNDSFTEFRGKGIGSSDMPVLMGVSPWSTPYKLWLDKTGIKPSEFKGNAATRRGNELEPMVRNWYNEKHGVVMIPKRFTHPDHSHFRCNVDGVDTSVRKLIEIKCGNLEDHVRAFRAGVIPEKYYPQCQWLMFVSGIHELDYVSYNDKAIDNEFCVVPVEYDQDYVDSMVQVASEFWDNVQSKTPPVMSSKDRIVIDSKDLATLLVEYDQLELESSRINDRLKKLKAEISTYVEHERAECQGYNLNWVVRKGSVDYSRIDSLKNVDLEAYRKPETRYFTLKKSKGD